MFRAVSASLPVALWAASTLLLSACGQPGADGASAEAGGGRNLTAGEPAYLAPPQISVARRQPNGEIDMAGRAAAGSVVRLASPDGTQLSASTESDGGWRLTLPASDAPRLYALSATLGSRVLRGEGAVAITPAPGPAALLLRAGGPALPLDTEVKGLVFEAVDFDGGGGLAAAGAAPAQSPLRLSLDGRPAAVGQADAAGRFGLLAVQGDLKPGRHRLRLEGPGGAIEREVEATPAPPPTGQAFSARRADAGWRIDWATPGGGAQSTVLFDRPTVRGR